MCCMCRHVFCLALCTCVDIMYLKHVEVVNVVCIVHVHVCTSGGRMCGHILQPLHNQFRVSLVKCDSVS